MKKIPLKQAYNRLRECSAVIVDNDVVTYPSLADLTGEKENEFLYVSWDDDAGFTYAVKFVEENNQEVKVTDDGCLMLLVDNEGSKVQLTLLKPATSWDNEMADVSMYINQTCRTC
jgi:hypothetical protein